MNTIIAFTPAELCKLVLSICGGIVAVSAAIGVIATLVKKAKSPNQLQNDRLDSIEKRLDEHDEYFAKDKAKLEAIAEGNRISQRALLALLAHGIDGNEIEGMREAKNELTDYLLRR